MVAGGGYKSLDRRGGDGNRSSRITVGSRVGLSPVLVPTVLCEMKSRLSARIGGAEQSGLSGL